jgi:hypothetical protein
MIWWDGFFYVMRQIQLVIFIINYNYHSYESRYLDLCLLVIYDGVGVDGFSETYSLTT